MKGLNYMAAKKYYFILTLFLIIVLFANGINVQSVRADGETPTEPPAATEVVTEAPVVETQAPAVSQAPEEATATSETVVETASPEEENTSADAVVSQAPQNTDIVVLDDQGQALTLGSQETANALVTSDPVWCPHTRCQWL
jgi:hypothetical protein